MNYNYEQQKIYLTDFINSLSLERNLSGKTIYAYKSDLLCMFTWLNENKYESINPHSISDYFLYLQNNKKLSPRSIRRKYVSIKQFFHYINVEKGVNEIFVQKVSVTKITAAYLIKDGSKSADCYCFKRIQISFN